MLTLLFVALLAGCASQQSEQGTEANRPDTSEMVQRQLDLGVGYLRQGDYRRAKEKLGRALEIDPKNAVAHAMFGMLFQLEGENDLAEQYFKDAIRYDPDDAQARNSYGAFLFAQARYHEAVEQLTKAAENRFYPNRSTVFENLGVAYEKIGDVEAADFAFTRAVQLNPTQSRALLELGEIRFEQRNYVEARDFYKRHNRIAQTSSKSLWLCVRLAKIFRDVNEEASCAQGLEGIFPASDEYRMYKESR